MANDKEFLIRVKADIQDAVKQMRSMSNEVGKTGKNAKAAKPGVDNLGGSLNRLKQAAGAYITLRLAISLLKDADAYAVLQQRVKTATKATGDYVAVSAELYNISRQNGVALRDTISLFQNLARTAPELKATNDEMLELTNLVQQLGVIGGSTKSQLSAGLLQFSQGLAGMVFRAEEYNSIVENIPELAARIAKGLGKSTGELRKAVIEGKVLSTDVFEALKKQAGEINAEFEDIPTSMERAGVSLANSFSRISAQADKISGATSFWTRVLQNTAELFDNISDSTDTDNLESQINVLERLNHRLDGFLERGQENSHVMTILLRQINKVSDNVSRLSAETDKLTNSQKIETIEVNKQQASVDKLIEKLRTQRDTLKFTNDELVIYKLNLLGASPEEINLAKSIQGTTAALKEKHSLMEEGKRVIEDNKTEQDKLADTLTRLDFLYEKGALGTIGSTEAMDNYSRAVFKAIDGLEDFGETGKETFDELLAATKGWGQEFANTLADMVVDGKGSFKDLADTIIKEILRILIYQQLVKPILGSFNVDAPTNSTPAIISHTGGMAGSGPSRSVSPLVFAGAPRYHNGGIAGLRSNEIPSILEAGEEVLTRDDPRHILNQGQGGGGGSVKVELVNKGSPSEATQANTRFDGNDFVVSIVLDDLDRNGKISGALDNKFGVR